MGGATLLHRWFLPITVYSAGVDLVYLPAGIRTVLLLVGGIWAAVGISLANFFITGEQFGVLDNATLLGLAMYTGFAPYLGLRATMSLLRIDPGLRSLLPIHLAPICLGVAALSSALHSLLFCALGVQSWDSLPAATFAMAAGDFTGSLLIVLLLLGVIRLYKNRKRQRVH